MRVMSVPVAPRPRTKQLAPKFCAVATLARASVRKAEVSFIVGGSGCVIRPSMLLGYLCLSGWALVSVCDAEDTVVRFSLP